MRSLPTLAASVLMIGAALVACDQTGDQVSQAAKDAWVAVPSNQKESWCVLAGLSRPDDAIHEARQVARSIVRTTTDIEPSDDRYYDLVEDAKWVFLGEVARYCG